MQLLHLFPLVSFILAVPQYGDYPGVPPTTPPTVPVSFARKPDMADYRILYNLLKSASKSDSIAHWSRSAFHDLANFNPATGQGGPHGCLKDDPVRSMSQNLQLDNTIIRLNRLINQQLPGIAYPFGDVISMAGKVAMERAYPCIRIKWRPGRPACGLEVESGPSPHIQTLKDMQPFLKRYSLSAREMAILLAGTHGIKEAVLHTNEGQKPWIDINSPLKFIKDSIGLSWSPRSDLTFQTKTIKFIYEAKDFIRLPVDLFFFPTSVESSIAKSKTLATKLNIVSDQSPEIISLEKDLQGLAKADNKTAVEIEFAKTFSKMLEIGTKRGELGPWYVDIEPHDDGSFRRVCPNGIINL